MVELDIPKIVMFLKGVSLEGADVATHSAVLSIGRECG